MLNVIKVGCQVAGTTTTNVTPATPGTVTSVVTTGPDGTPLDEGSQQSTLSNASAGMMSSHALFVFSGTHRAAEQTVTALHTV
jgi:hypothetical protein